MGRVRAIFSYWSQGWPDALACALAAALSWLLAQAMFGHAQPIFASVAAVVCLAPGIPSRAGQALNMMLGLVTGILVGEAVLLLAPPMNTALLIPIIVFLAIMAAICFGMLPVIAIQGGVSALLVLALGPVAAGEARFLDALVGTGIGLLFSQLLFTPDPARLIERAAAGLLRDMAAPLSRLADAVASARADEAIAARAQLVEARASVNLLQLRIEAAAGIVRWSFRGRLRAKRVRELTSIYQCRGMVLYAAALVLADALAMKLSQTSHPQQALAARIRDIASSLTAPANDKQPPPQETREPCADQDWRICLESLEALERLTEGLRGERERGQPRA